ncbi:MAG: hypothetical protein HYX40_04045 [Sphingobacteriales bacterium]|nr:hypothetical protein [Sphingobacteriales bacterium]
MNPKTKPVLLVIALIVLAVAALRGHNKPPDTDDYSTLPNITVMLNFNSAIQ